MQKWKSETKRNEILSDRSYVSFIVEVTKIKESLKIKLKNWKRHFSNKKKTKNKMSVLETGEKMQKKREKKPT